MACEHEIAQNIITVLLDKITDGKEIASRFGHFLLVDIDEPIVHPVMYKRFAVGCLTLGDFIFMVREIRS